MAERGPNPFLELTRTRMLEFVRRPGTLFWVFGFPVAMALVLGLAFRERPPAAFRVALVAETPEARLLAHALDEHDQLEVSTLDAGQARDALRRARVDVVATAHADGTFDYAWDKDRAESLTARLALDNALQRHLGRRDRARTRDVAVIERGDRYIDFLIPGLLGLNIMGSALWGIGFVIVTARTDKLLKRYAVTPMNRAHFLLSFFTSRLVFLVAQVLSLLAIAYWVFDFEIAGSVGAMSVILVAGAASFGGIALLVAARPMSVEAAQGWMNLVQLPMWIFCGCFFAWERFPEAVHPLLRLLPLTAINDALRAIMNDGAALSATLPELAVLAGWAALSFVLALRVFRWQ